MIFVIHKGGLYHRPKSNFAYGYNNETLHIRVRAMKGEVKKAICRIGDPYLWERGGAGGGNLEASGSYGWKSENIPMKLEATTQYHDYFFIEVPRETKRSRYAFILENDNERLLYGERRIIDLDDTDKEKQVLNDLSNFFCFPYLNAIDVLKTPQWAKETVWYQIFPERFANGDKSNDPENTEPWGSEPTFNNYMGGDLQGIMDKLDYLVDLGITGILFCPLFKANSNHKYQTIDYYQIDPGFGTNELFKQFVEKAHEKGIRIMLDGVFNHVGYRHPFCQDVVEKGEQSIYKDWFCIKEFPVKKGGYETFATTPHMPKVNLEFEAARDYFLDVGRFWVEEFNIDGWRLDVANEISHSFWKQFRQTIKQINKDVFILGEVWHDALPWIQGDQYDSVMHYPVTDACKRYFALNQMTKKEFIDTINHIIVNYPKNASESMYNLLNTHDTSRFLSVAGEDSRKLLLAYVFIFTYPGCPSIYYGDEIGLSGHKGSSENHRRCMPWDESLWNHDLRNSIKSLISIRKDNRDFVSGDIEWLDHIIDDTQCLAYRRENCLVFINPTDEHRVLSLPEIYSSLEDLRTKQLINNTEIDVRAWDYRIIKIK